VARSKARRPEPTDAIAEIESLGDRAIEWVENNAKVVLGVVVVCLVIASAYGFYDSSQNRRENASFDALAGVRTEYLQAMGASPGAIEVPELANPAAGAQIRREYSERFGVVAEEHAGTAGAAMAQLEQGNLAADAGEAETALAIWREAVDALPADSPLVGVISQRMAHALEDHGDWEAAAEAYAAAAAVDAYTLRHWAMAEAARCYARANLPHKALALFEKLEAEAPNLELPDHLRIQLRELQVAVPSSS
jgi:tetratricopeptide (TPR) repeat protein